MNIHQTILELSSLPIDERLHVVQLLWDSIPQNADVPVTSDQLAELNRRVSNHASNPATALSRDQLEQRIKGNF